MKRWWLGVLFVGGVVLIAGCGRATFMTDGSLALDLGAEQTTPTTASYDVGPTILDRFFGVQEESGTNGADPNARAAANCAGGVCTIF